MANVGAYAGYVCLMPETHEKMTLGPNMFLIRTNLFNQFAYYCLSAVYCNEQLKLMAISSAQPKLNKDNIREIKIVLPSFQEQLKISSYLDLKTHQIDDMIAKKHKLIELLKEERTVLIKNAVRKGLDPDVPMKESEIEWLGEIPEHWDSAKIKRYSLIETGGTPSRSNPEYWDNGTINWLTSGEVNKRVINGVDNKISIIGYENSNARLLPINTIMIALNGQGKTKAMSAILKVESTCNQSLAGFICDEKKLHFSFLFYFLQSKYKDLRGLVGNESREGLSISVLKTIYAPLPPIEEQKYIAGYLDNCYDKAEKTIGIIEKEIALISEYKTSLINEAVTGKIDVRG